MTKVEEVVIAADTFAAHGRTHTDIQIIHEAKVDQLIPHLRDTFAHHLNDATMGEYFFFFSKWALYKTVYSFQPGFLDALSDTEDTIFHLEALRSLPVPCFFIATPGTDRIGIFVYVELTDKEAFFDAIEVTGVDGENLDMSTDSLWIHDRQSIHEALTAWMENINNGADYSPYYERAYKNLSLAIQTAYYLSASNSVKTEIKTPKAKRPKRRNGTPMNLRQWEVGYRIGSPFPGKRAEEGPCEAVGATEGERGTRPRPHLRRAHWHHYWAGEGKNTLILKWLAPIWVNGNEEDIISTEHPVQEGAR